jgi:hypothetical protein
MLWMAPNKELFRGKKFTGQIFKTFPSPYFFSEAWGKFYIEKEGKSSNKCN